MFYKFISSIVIALLANNLIISQNSNVSIAHAANSSAGQNGFNYQVEFKVRYSLEKDKVRLRVRPIKVYNVSYYYNGKYYQDLSFLSKYESTYKQPLSSFVDGLYHITVSAAHNISKKRISNITWGKNIMTMGNNALGTPLLDREIEDIKNWAKDNRGWNSHATVAIHSIEFNNQKWREEVTNKAFEKFFSDKKKQETFEKLLNDAEKTNDKEKKRKILEEAKKYTNNKALIDDRIRKLRTNNLNGNENFSEKKTPDNSSYLKQSNYNLETFSSKLKEPSGYSKEEWKTLPQDVKDKSLDLQISNMRERWAEDDRKSKEIDKKLEMSSQGYMQLAQGNYIAASNTFSAAGDYQGAAAALAVGAFDQMFSGFKEARDRKIKQRTNRLKKSLDSIKQISEELDSINPKKEPQKFVKVNWRLLNNKINALTYGLDLIRKERRDQKKKYRQQMGNIWLDMMYQANFMVNNPKISSEEKLKSLNALPSAFFRDNINALLLYKNHIDNNELVANSFKDIYSNFIASSLFDFKPNERLEILLQSPVTMKEFESFGYGENLIYSDFLSLDIKQQQGLVSPDLLEVRHIFNIADISNNSDLDDKITFLLQNGLDYHFQYDDKLTFNQVVTESTFNNSNPFTGFISRKLRGLKKSRGYLDARITEDQNVLNKKYNEVLDEKYINRKLDSLNSGTYSMTQAVQLDERFATLNEKANDNNTLFIFWDKVMFPSFKKLEFYINNGEVHQILKGSYYVFHNSTEVSKIRFVDAIEPYVLRTDKTKIDFIKIVHEKGTNKYTFEPITYAEGIRLSGVLKKKAAK